MVRLCNSDGNNSIAKKHNYDWKTTNKDRKPLHTDEDQFDVATKYFGDDGSTLTKKRCQMIMTERQPTPVRGSETLTKNDLKITRSSLMNTWNGMKIARNS
jgi:glutamine cyclotransferase